MPRGAEKRVKAWDEMNVLLSGGLLSRAKTSLAKPLLYLTGRSAESVGLRHPRNERMRKTYWRLRLVQEILAVQRIPLRGTETRVTDDPPQLFLGRAVGDTGCSHNVLLQHH